MGDGSQHDPDFLFAFFSAADGPTDLSFEADFPAPSFDGILDAVRYHYETFTDVLGHDFVIRTDLETGARERFILPPPTARS